MWEHLNQILLILEVLILFIAFGYSVYKKKTTMPLTLGAIIAVLAFLVYLIPSCYTIVNTGSGHWLFDTMSNFYITGKMFVGEFYTHKVDAYTTLYPWYALNFFFAAFLAVWASFSVAIHVFGNKIRNWYRRKKYFKAEVCDLVIGNNSDALQYAKNNSNVVLMPPETTTKDTIVSLMEDGYTVFKRNISAEFLKSRMFDKKTQYHIIYLDESLDIFYEIHQICEYLQTAEANSNLHFYLEAKENTLELVQQQIDLKDNQDQRSNLKENPTPYREFITIFNRNELIARTFTEQYPVTRSMPSDFFEQDCSVKETVSVRMFFLGYTPLSQEIYRNSVINNQLAVYRDGEYRVFPVEYHIYDNMIPEESWEISGIQDALKILSENESLYFKLPELPYHTVCHKQMPCEMETLRGILDLGTDSDSLNYFIIDTGDLYRNLDISNKLQLLLNNDSHYHIFVYHNFLSETSGERVSFYGNLKHIFTHGVLVDESLLSLAKTIDREYLKQYKDSIKETYTPDSLLQESIENWKKASYFNRYSNIFLANNLRLKLNLLGLDYQEDSCGEGLDLLTEHYPIREEKNKKMGSYFERNVKNALLAQEHFRWNAYHLLSGYLPMKKERMIVKCEGVTDDGLPELKIQNKNNPAKKHACLTTYHGVSEVSSYLAEKANQSTGSKTYRPEDFDYYKYDEMLLKVAPAFLKKEKHSIKLR